MPHVQEFCFLELKSALSSFLCFVLSVKLSVVRTEQRVFHLHYSYLLEPVAQAVCLTLPSLSKSRDVYHFRRLNRGKEKGKKVSK